MNDERDWESEVTESPWTLIMESLTLQAKGEPIPDDLRDATEAAGTLLAASVLVQGGGDIDAVLRQFEERDHTFHFNYDTRTDEIGIEVRWDDGDSANVTVCATDR